MGINPMKFIQNYLASRRDHQKMPGAESRSPTRLLSVFTIFLLLILGCSAADLVERQRETPAPTEVVALAPTFTPTPIVLQTLVVVTPPSDGKPGVIIVPPGMDPNTVLPATPTPIPIITPSPPSPLVEATQAAPTIPQAPESPLLTAEAPGTGLEQQPLEQPTPIAPPAETIEPVLVPTDTPTPMGGQPADSFPPAETPTATPIPTPFVIVNSGLVALRTGPGVEYPLVAQLGPNIPVAVIGRNTDNTWLEICCVSGATVWVASQHVQVQNDIFTVAQSVAGPPPTETPTATPTETATVTPTPTATSYPFERAIGPQFFPTDNESLTIWAKLFIGTPPLEVPAEGYYLVVKFEGFVRPNAAGNVASRDVFEFSAPPGFGNRVSYNYKYEYRPPDPKSLDPNSSATPLQLLGTGTWSIYVADGAGTQLSEEVTFTTAPSNPNREIYVGWVRIR
jgi:hypothetical protein